MNSGTPIRVAIVEDNPRFRDSLAALLRESPGFALVAECVDAESAMRELPALGPDVVLMDIHLPGDSGIKCVRALRRPLADSALLMLTIEQSNRKLMESLEAGADGYLVKTTTTTRLLEAIQEAHQGGSPISSHMARLLVQRFHAVGTSPQVANSLSSRERQILMQLSTGQRAKEVADELHISVHTVRAGVRSIYRKLHARSVPEAVVKFTEQERR